MAIRDQRIDIGYGAERIRRIVYDCRDDLNWQLQTGYVRYDSNRIPVWRPLDPDDLGYAAPWRNGIWRNIHAVVMAHDRGAKFIAYETEGYDTGTDKIIRLPRVEVRLTRGLLDHLARAAK